MKAFATKEIVAGVLGLSALAFQSETAFIVAGGFLAYGLIDSLIGIRAIDLLPREQLPKSKSRFRS